MFSSPYHDEEETAVHGLAPPASYSEDGVASQPRVLVADSDNDDSLGTAPLCHQNTPSAPASPPPRAFSKRAAKCAAGLLRQHASATTGAQKANCMQQLRRLGGAYKALGEGQSATVWVRYADLRARVIRETEAYFDGKLSVRAKDGCRSCGGGPTALKPEVQMSSGRQRETPCGSRSPLPSPSRGVDCTRDFTLSRSEQFTLSLLAMGDTAERDGAGETVPTYLLRKGADGEMHRVSIPSAAATPPADMRASSLFGLSSYASSTPRTPTPGWFYDEAEDETAVLENGQSAARSDRSPGAASRPSKRGRRDGDTPTHKSLCSETSRAARALFTGVCSGDWLSSELNVGSFVEETSVVGASCLSTSLAAPRSLSATVIEHQNHRVQRDLFRQQSLFGSF